MRRNLSFYILIILALAALGVLIYLLAPGSAADTPAVVLATPALPESGAPVVSDDPGLRVLSIRTDTVQAALSTLSRADSYSRTLTAQSFWNGGSAVTEIDVWVRGGYTRLSIREGSADAVKNVLIKGDEEWIWYSDGEGVWHGSAKARDADAWQALLTYEDVLTLDRSAISDAGYADYNGEYCIFVRYTAGELGYEHLCYISDSSGLLVGSETYDGDVLVFSLRSTTPDISTPGDEVFDEP